MFDIAIQTILTGPVFLTDHTLSYLGKLYLDFQKTDNTLILVNIFEADSLRNISGSSNSF